MGASPGPFVATTALEEFWDTPQPMVFMGESCLRYSRRSVWEPLLREKLASPWEDDARLSEAYDQVNDVIEHLLPRLADRLNRVHGTNHGLRFWRIQLGPWLMLYVPSVFDRFACARSALARFPDLTTLTLAPSSFVIPQDTFDYSVWAHTEFYNLQVISKVFTFLGKEFPSKEFKPPPGIHPRPRRSSPFALSGYIKGTFNLAARHAKGMLLEDPPFPPRMYVRMAVHTRGRVFPRFSGGYESHSWATDESLREGLAGIELGGGAFEGLLSRVLPMDIPKSFVEGFRNLGEEASRRFPASPKAVLSTSGWYYDEVFKRWAGEGAERGVKLFGCQHGGNYGSLASNPSEDHEVAVTDRYYTWGWKRAGDSRTVPMPAPLLAGVPKIGAESEKRGILLLTTSASRFVQGLTLTPERTRHYFERQLRFAAALAPRERAALVHRPHFADYGWDIAARWRDRFPDVVVQEWDVPFNRALRECRLFVCDHFSTTYAQALALDKPCILFWETQSNEFRVRPEAREFHDALRSAGILHDEPEAAAAEAARAYGDVEAWWADPGRREARRLFCERFVRTAPDPMSEWVAEFDAVVREL